MQAAAGSRPGGGWGGGGFSPSLQQDGSSPTRSFRPFSRSVDLPSLLLPFASRLLLRVIKARNDSIARAPFSPPAAASAPTSASPSASSTPSSRSPTGARPPPLHVRLHSLPVAAIAASAPVSPSRPSPSSPVPIPACPFLLSIDCALLFVDISGFTALTERMVQSGAQGLEQLTETINTLFTAVLSCLERYGGDMLNVAGDALIVAFTADSEREGRAGSLPELCSRALDCAIALQLGCDEYSVADYQLRLHVAVTAGRAQHFFIVGGVARRWDKDAASEVTEAEERADGPSLSPSGITPATLELPPASPADGCPQTRCEFLAVGSAFDELATTVPLSQAGEIAVSETALTQAQTVRQYDAEPVTGSRHCKIRMSWYRSLDAREAERKQEDGAVTTALSGAFEARDGQPRLSSHLSAANFVMPALLSRLQLDSGVAFSPAARLSPAARISRQPSLSFGPGAGMTRTGSWLAEYRRVTVLFMSLPVPDRCVAQSETGSGLTSPTSPSSPSSALPGWLVAFQSIFLLIQQCVFSLGGQIRQLLVDDKGCVCIAVFGLPPFCSEHDAVRGVTAALNIQLRVAALTPPLTTVRIGITSGRCYCGFVGSAQRKEFVVLGDVVNLSARLMAVARRHDRLILTDEETMRDSRSRIAWAATSPLSVPVKGQHQPILVYTPTEVLLSIQQRARSHSASRSSSSPSSTSPLPSLQLPPAPASSQPPVIHLAPELQEGVSGGLEDVCLGRHVTFETVTTLATSPPSPSPVIVVQADAGVGKSFLTRRVLDACAIAHVSTLVVAADDMERTTPYHAFITITQQALEAHQARTGAASMRDCLMAMLPAHDRPFLSVLHDVLPSLQLQEGDELEVEASGRTAATCRLLRSLLSCHFRLEPRSLIVIEDAHWLDVKSWALLKELVTACPSITLYLTVRPLEGLTTSPPQAVATDFQAVLAAERTRRFLLLGLDLRDTTALTQHLLRCRSLSPALQSLIYARTEGIPLFIQHLVAFCVDSSLVEVDAASGQADLKESIRKSRGGNASESAVQLSDLLPGSLQALLASVLDRLQPQTQFLLKVASVIGRAFHERVLWETSQSAVGDAMTFEELQQMLDHAQQKRVIHLVDSDGAVRQTAAALLHSSPASSHASPLPLLLRFCSSGRQRRVASVRSHPRPGRGLQLTAVLSAARAALHPRCDARVLASEQQCSAGRHGVHSVSGQSLLAVGVRRQRSGDGCA